MNLQQNINLIGCKQIGSVLRKASEEYGWDDYCFTFRHRKQPTDKYTFICEASREKKMFMYEYIRLGLDPVNPLRRLVLRNDMPQAYRYEDYAKNPTKKEKQFFELVAKYRWRSGLHLVQYGYGGALGGVEFLTTEDDISAEKKYETSRFIVPWLMQFNAWARELMSSILAKTVLTEREMECMNLVSKGNTSKEIANILSITKRRVDFHVESAVKKMGAVNRSQAVSHFPLFISRVSG
ncbi:MAG: helix-turn-helix transcriptional regulator [Porticoccaceae bacterium]